MIYKEDKDKLLTVLGNRYSPYIKKFFNQNGITNADGTEVRNNTIVMVMNGQLEHAVFELNIYKAFSKKQKEQAQQQAYREKVLGTKKPEGATSGSY